MLDRFRVMRDAGLREVDGSSNGEETAQVYELLALVAALDGVDQLLACPPRASATVREELWAAAEIVGWVVELLPGADASLVELQHRLLRGQAALAAAAEHPDESRQWDEVRSSLTSTRRLLTVTAAGLVP